MLVAIGLFILIYTTNVLSQKQHNNSRQTKNTILVFPAVSQLFIFILEMKKQEKKKRKKGLFGHAEWNFRCRIL